MRFRYPVISTPRDLAVRVNRWRREKIVKTTKGQRHLAPPNLLSHGSLGSVDYEIP